MICNVMKQERLPWPIWSTPFLPHASPHASISLPIRCYGIVTHYTLYTISTNIWYHVVEYNESDYKDVLSAIIDCLNAVLY